MKVFMSWSGQRSKLTAELLYEWVKCVIQAAQPWISSKGIERGAMWFSEINNQLADTTVGVICITQENKNAPWILFEAGALAKGLSSNRVCTFLVDLEPADLQPPLAQFNHTFPVRESMWNLVNTLNNGLENNRLEPNVLERVFNTYWPQFEEAFAAILETNPPVTPVAPRDQNDMLAEILESTRSMSQRIRNLESKNGIAVGLGGGLSDIDAWTGKRVGKKVYLSAPESLREFYAAYAVSELTKGQSLEEIREALLKNPDVTTDVIDDILRRANLVMVPARVNAAKGSTPPTPPPTPA